LAPTCFVPAALAADSWEGRRASALRRTPLPQEKPVDRDTSVLIAQTRGSQTLRRSDPATAEPAELPAYHPEKQASPNMSPEATPTAYERGRFGGDPVYPTGPYDTKSQIEIYGGKSRVNGPRPPLELGHPMYQEGPLPDSINLFGEKNLARPQLLVYGDWRTAAAWNDNGNTETGLVATRLNVDVDLKLTSTERIHMFVRPFDKGNKGQFTRYEFFGDDRKRGDLQVDGNIETLFFEGDLGALAAGLTGDYNAYDIPVAFGLMPLLFQNGLWLEDAFVGGALTIPARNNRFLDISNMDLTFFAGSDKVTTQAIRETGRNVPDDNSASIFGIAAFADLQEGYLEAGYGYTQDRRGGAFDFDYHNATLAFTRRYGGWLSNSVRGVWNFGQKPALGQRQTADGYLLVMENSLITSKPLTLVPYANFFVGHDRPQSLARDFGAGGILKTVGINFETDGLTGFPKLDDTANDTYGGAVGIQYLFNLDQQIVVEVASAQVIGGNNKPGRTAKGDQYAIGARYQIPLSMATIFRTDVIQAWRGEDTDTAGIRFEIRVKF
ncbi:MAG: hypothetical protein VW600_07665, partial [Ferrovibrio sp.]